MFWDKKYRQLDKEILKDANYFSENEDDVIIDVKVDNNTQLFSDYNYDNKKTLHKDLCDYLWENTKLVPSNKDLTINIYDRSTVTENQIEKAIKNHYRREYKHAKNKLEKINIFTLSCLIVGILFLAALVFLHEAINNYYVDIIFEIIAWVLIWEAVDRFFLERPSIKRQCKRIQKLYSAKVVVIK